MAVWTRAVAGEIVGGGRILRSWRQDFQNVEVD